MDCLPVEVTCEAQVGLWGWGGVLMFGTGCVYRMCGVDCFPVAVTYETQVGRGGGGGGGALCCLVQDVQGGLFACRGHL